jgi:hypothetical protein
VKLFGGAVKGEFVAFGEPTGRRPLLIERGQNNLPVFSGNLPRPSLLETVQFVLPENAAKVRIGDVEIGGVPSRLISRDMLSVF